MSDLISTDVLGELKCVNCKKVLSYFPIFYHPEGATCGRCPYPTSGVRNVQYEVLASKLKFPCCYNSNGCLDYVLPKDVAVHEKYCGYKKHKCPVISANCDWIGFASDLYDHVDSNHPTFIVDDNGFELDFVNEHNENYLFLFGEDLFLVNRLIVKCINSFIVSYIGTDKQVDKGSYKITLINCGTDSKHEITTKLNSATIIHKEMIMNALEEPLSVIVKIDVLLYKNDDGCKVVDNKVNPDINYDLLRELECMVCYEFMVAPIYQCLTGHSICSTCKLSVKECPSCKAEIKNQNYVLAQVTNHLIYPCKYNDCTFTAKGTAIKQHEERCVYATILCPLNDYTGCDLQFKFQDLYAHVMNNHDEYVIQTDWVSLPVDFDCDFSDFTDCFVIKFSLRLFKLHISFDDYGMRFAAQLIGPVEEARLFRFEIEVFHANDKNNRVVASKMCGGLTKANEAFNDVGNYVYFKRKEIIHLISHLLRFKVRIHCINN